MLMRWLKLTVGLVTLLAVVTTVTSQLTGLNLVSSAVIGAVISILMVLMFDNKSNRHQLNTTLMRFNTPPSEKKPS